MLRTAGSFVFRRDLEIFSLSIFLIFCEAKFVFNGTFMVPARLGFISCLPRIGARVLEADPS